MKFSIIVPVYNTEKYLRPCLESILAQTISDWECICIDDGSIDSSRDILFEYANRDERFIVMQQENVGPGPARNKGIEMACGEWLLFVDSDDLIAPYTLQTVLNIENGADIVRMGLRRFSPECDFLAELNQDEPFDWQTSQFTEITYQLFMDGWPQFAYRREKIADIRQRSYRLGEDKLYQMECFSRASSITKTNRLVYGYRSSAESLTHRPLTFELLKDEISWHIECNKLFKAAHKKLDDKICRQEEIFWAEQFPVWARSLKNDESSVKLLEMWHINLNTVIELGKIIHIRRALLLVMKIIPLKAIPFVILCDLPYWGRRKMSRLIRLIHNLVIKGVMV